MQMLTMTMDLESEGLVAQQQKASGRRPVGSSQIWTVSFCERWNNETNTAHFMGFEMAPSLRDVSYILGIPVVGHVVSAEPIGDEAVKRMCLHYLGESPGNGEQLCGLIRLTWLYRKFHQLPENPTINEIAYSTRAYLLYLVGSTLFPDTMRGFVSPRYLPLLADFRKIREYAWGAAALAHLYRGLSVAVTPNATTQFLGSATLLMVNWNPYKDMNPAIVPEYCIAADNICYSRTWLISFNIKEVYVPDRFSRQFGREQGRLHAVPMWARRTWSKSKDWRVEYAREIEEFHQLVGCHFTPPAETNVTALPPVEPVAEQNATGYSSTSQKISTMVEDLKNDLPVIDRYLEERLLPVEVSSFLERVSTMIKSYSPPQGCGRTNEAPQFRTGTVRSKKPRKRVKASRFQDTSSPPDSRADRYAGTLPHQTAKCDTVFDGTVPLGSGGKGCNEAMEPWQISQLMTPSASSPESSSSESRKRSWQSCNEARIPRDADVLRRSGRLCVQLKMFKHRDGVGAGSADPIVL
ncbi:hypothetical protein EJB05_52360, partial [Eragrostis curvula]